MNFRKVTISVFVAALLLVMVSCNVDNSNSPSTVTKKAELTTPGFNDQYIIVLKDSKDANTLSYISPDVRARMILSSNGIPPEALIFVYDKVLNGFAAKMTLEQANKLAADPRVSYVEPDQEVKLPDDMIENVDMKKDQTQTQTTPWGISYVGGFINSSSISNVAWILDTGVDLTHSDLNVVTSRCTTFVTSGQDARTANDLHGHGTHVAGTIAAKNNTIGVVGVAAGAGVVAVKVLNRYGSGTYSQIISGLNYAARYGTNGDVVNLSLGGSPSTALDNAVSNCASYGLYIAIAAGNSSANANNYSPARVNGTGIYTVSAHNSSGYFASFSNYGNPPIDYCAPGVSVYSTYKGNRYATMSGTSMAAPHVAGILLATGGQITNRGTVSGDRDSSPDPLAYHN